MSSISWTQLGQNVLQLDTNLKVPPLIMFLELFCTWPSLLFLHFFVPTYPLAPSWHLSAPLGLRDPGREIGWIQNDAGFWLHYFHFDVNMWSVYTDLLPWAIIGSGNQKKRNVAFEWLLGGALGTTS